MKTFSDTLKELRGGCADADAGVQLTELIAAVRASGRAGSLVVEIKVKPLDQGDGTQVTVEDHVKVKKPAPKPVSTVFFTTEEGALSRRDPRQPELRNLRDVSEAAEVRRFPEKANEG